MQYSLVDRVRVRPSPKGRGACPACDKPTIAKCGSQIVWHWAHDRAAHCDRWWESETKWHLEWKARFPEEWQEVLKVDGSTSERHIADIVTSRGMVIELQNSPIPERELKARETFYRRMMWIVNAEPFATSFSLGKALPHPDNPFADAIAIGKSLRRDRAPASSRRCRWERTPGLLERPNQPEAPKERPYLGYHLFTWRRPRKVWLNATCPVFLDFGADDLLWLCTHPATTRPCVRLVSKQALIRKNGGDPGPAPYHGTYRGHPFAG